MHIVESPNPPNDMRRSYGIWGKLFGWFWAINPCILVESSQLSMKVINSFVVQKKNISGFSLSMHFEHLHRTSYDYCITYSVFPWHHHASSASTRRQISLHVRWLKKISKKNKDKQGDNKRNSKSRMFVSSPKKKTKSDPLLSTGWDRSHKTSDILRMSGDGDDLESICSNNGIPANLFSTIVTTGWSVSTIAMGFSDASEFDQETTLRDLGITEDISRLERASLKVMWAQCKQIFQAHQTKSQSSAPGEEVPNAASPAPSSIVFLTVDGMKHFHPS